MTDPRLQPAQDRTAPLVPGVASIAIRELLSEPVQATVLGTESLAVWLLVSDQVIVVSTSEATRLPNSIEINATARDAPFDRVNRGATAGIGANRVELDGLRVEIARWWDPRPVLKTADTSSLAAAIVGLPPAVPDLDAPTLGNALSACDADAVLAASLPLLGKGPGLTPDGDDYLAGALSATRLFAAAMGKAAAMEMLDESSARLADLAHARTSTFSASLIGHALRGQVAAPAGFILKALAGQGDVADSHRALLDVGHSSGQALAAGIVLGIQALIDSAVD